MLASKDYSKLTRDELVLEEKTLKSQKITTAVFIGFLVGIAVWSATHKGFVLPVILLLGAFLLGSRNHQNLKSVQAEINRKDTIR
ncbi:hypothetical protein [Spirosoma pollinicola]|uniref:FUSC family protein n=1 Tax=Spirosoma pollinicola TaxID=2057025 RepID=A0A2K8YZ35_9BACT|nr:hypothetical protein [Spirosoma pollinicola]AUD02910.1 hypothetical protein CWM47_14355 [Spirosoma pollinicola]